MKVARTDDVELELGIPVAHRPPSPLAMTAAEVAVLTRRQRSARLAELIADSHRIYAAGVEEHVLGADRQLAGVVGLFSGGNDSTVLAHLFRRELTHLGHAHTTVGIEATRTFVRQTAAAWQLPLLERKPPRLRDHYRAMVLDPSLDEDGRPIGGFPGPRLHWKAYQRLKLRGIERMQLELVDGRHRTHRVLFLAGRRRDESTNRSDVPEHERKGSRVWSSPMVHWTKLDLNTYRLEAAAAGDPVPVNDVTGIIHMSGECLCGSYANVGERAQLDAWFWDDLDLIRELEHELRTNPSLAHIPAHRRTWGWAGIPELAAASRLYDARELEPQAGGLCGSCPPPDHPMLTDLLEEPA